MKRIVPLLMLLTLSGVSSVADGSIFLSAERFGYTGTWTRHSTLADAQAGINVIETGGMPQRDLAIYVSQGITDNSFDPAYLFLTRWYGPSSGNPNNVNDGFFQYYDIDASTITALNGYWSADLTTFFLQGSSVNADYPNDFARFGERAGGPGSATEAIFHSLVVDLKMTGLTASYNGATGRYEGTDTSSASIMGSMTGVVQNVGTDGSRHGYYSFSLGLNDTSWAHDNGHVQTGELVAYSNNAVPEPASVFIFSMIPLALVGYRWRKRRRRRSMYLDVLAA